MWTARLTELQITQVYALYSWGLGAPSSFIYRENAADSIGLRIFIIDVALNPVLLKQNKNDTVCNFRAVAFISNKFLPVEILLLRCRAANNSILVCSWKRGWGVLSGNGVQGVRPSKMELVSWWLLLLTSAGRRIVWRKCSPSRWGWPWRAPELYSPGPWAQAGVMQGLRRSDKTGMWQHDFKGTVKESAPARGEWVRPATGGPWPPSYPSALIKGEATWHVQSKQGSLEWTGLPEPILQGFLC